MIKEAELSQFERRALEKAYPIDKMPIIVHEAPLSSPDDLSTAIRSYLQHGIVPGNEIKNLGIAERGSMHDSVYTKLIIAKGDKYRPGEIKGHANTMSFLISPQYYFQRVESLEPDENGAYKIKGEIPPDAIIGVIINPPRTTEVPKIRTRDWRKDDVGDYIDFPVKLDIDSINQAVVEIDSKRHGLFRTGPVRVEPRADYRVIGERGMILLEAMSDMLAPLFKGKLPKKHARTNIVSPIRLRSLFGYAFTKEHNDIKLTTAVSLESVDCAIEVGDLDSIGEMLAFFLKTYQIGILSEKGESCFSYLHKYLAQKELFNNPDMPQEVTITYPAILLEPRERILAGWDSILNQSRRIRHAEQRRAEDEKENFNLLNDIGRIMEEYDLPIPIFYSDKSLAWPVGMSPYELNVYKRKQYQLSS